MASLLIRVSYMERQLTDLLALNSRFVSKMEERMNAMQEKLNVVGTNQKVGKAQVALTLGVLSSAAAFIAWVGVMWATAWGPKK